MRISCLSRQTGLPVATIKFYLREGLLPPGTPTGRNQADYDEGHLRRLRLIRALTNVGKLDLSTVRQLLASIEDDELSLASLYGVIHSFPDDAAPPKLNGLADATADVDKLIDDLGWSISPDAAGRDRLVQVVAALRQLGCDCGIQFFAPYATTAEQLVAAEMDLLRPESEGIDRAAAVVRAVLLEVALTAVHRLAREHYVTNRFGPADDEPPGAGSAPG
ncbi:MerR family transcriptional regulator [Asanoa siamensis]|uniref:Transcriptional regulator n=1 Tax=Asanoa siamensis TaxID=926357 RepID=A0ABQ4CLF7_9ACTN|nr:MerR family transcriptional regulator [Asanoa siamensis]GIF72130.1 transcriptional regulator [Asanoa siamensis]